MKAGQAMTSQRGLMILTTTPMSICVNRECTSSNRLLYDCVREGAISESRIIPLAKAELGREFHTELKKIQITNVRRTS